MSVRLYVIHESEVNESVQQITSIIKISPLNEL